jgi:hypothetical protein
MKITVVGLLILIGVAALILFLIREWTRPQSDQEQGV